MDRLNHVKIVTPEPEAVDRFLTEVVELPPGWKLGDLPDRRHVEVMSPARDANNEFTEASVLAFRGATPGGGGHITGSAESRQFQILYGGHAHVWGVAISTRDLEGAHRRANELGYPVTEPNVINWGDGHLRYFFVEAGGIVFEVMRIEP